LPLNREGDLGDEKKSRSEAVYGDQRLVTTNCGKNEGGVCYLKEKSKNRRTQI